MRQNTRQMQAATTIQQWWRFMSEFRCPKCDGFYKGNWMCNDCYMERHADTIPENIWIDIEENEKERKRLSQEKKRTLGLIK